MAAVTITGAVWPDAGTARIGPFIDASLNLWVVAFNGSTKLTAYESADAGATWGTSFAATGTFLTDCVDCVFTGTVIYAVVCTTSHVLQLWSFTLATTTWAQLSTGTGPTVSPDANTHFPAFLARRSDGTFVVAYEGPVQASFRQAFYVTCSAVGTWGTATLAYGPSNTHVDIKCTVLGASDRTHFLFGKTPSAFPIQRSLSSANALDTAGTLTSNTTASDTGYYSLWYDGTTLYAGQLDDNRVYRAASGVTPTWTQDANATGSPAPASCAAALALTGGSLYVFYRDTASAHVYVDVSSTLTWPAAVQQDAATAVTGISVGKIAGAIGVVFNDSGVFFDKLPVGLPTLERHRGPARRAVAVARGRF